MLFPCGSPWTCHCPVPQISYLATKTARPASTTPIVAFPLTGSQAESCTLGSSTSWPACPSTGHTASQDWGQSLTEARVKLCFLYGRAETWGKVSINFPFFGIFSTSTGVCWNLLFHGSFQLTYLVWYSFSPGRGLWNSHGTSQSEPMLWRHWRQCLPQQLQPSSHPQPLLPAPMQTLELYQNHCERHTHVVWHEFCFLKRRKGLTPEPSSSWSAADALSSCAGTVEGTVQCGRSCRSPCCCWAPVLWLAGLDRPGAALWDNTVQNVTVSLTGKLDCFSSNAAHMASVDQNCCRRTRSSPLRSCSCFPRHQLESLVYGAGQHFSTISPSRSVAKVATGSNSWSCGCPQNYICLLFTL